LSVSSNLLLLDSVLIASSNFLWLPSQIGGNWVFLQVQNDTNLSDKAVYISGFLFCSSSLCDPSQNGCDLLNPQLHQ